MTYPRSRSVWLPLLMAVLTLPLVACDEVDLPVTVEEAPLFTSAAVNALSAQPANGSDVSAGTTVPFSLEVAFQRTAADRSALSIADLDVVVAVEDTDGFWAAGKTFTNEVSDARGTVTASGDLYVPLIGPTCGTADEGFTVTSIETSEDFPLGDIDAIDRVSFGITGGAENIGECVYDVINAASIYAPLVESRVMLHPIFGVARGGKILEESGGSDVLNAPLANTGDVTPWGTPIYVGGRYLNENPALLFPGTNFLLSVLRDPFVRWPTNPFFRGDNLGDFGFSSFWTWVPPGAFGTGPVRAATSQGEVVYGNDSPDRVSVPTDARDYFEPNDEMAEAHWDVMDFPLDGIFGEDVLLLNPFLTLPAHDRTIDPSKNPGGFSGWGVGDWHLIIPTLDPDAGVTTQDVCVAIFFDSNDDLDLFLYDPDGNLLSVSLQDTGNSEFVGTTTSTDLYVWVAPWMAPGEMNTVYGFYRVEGADCAAFASPPPSVTGSVEKLELLELPGSLQAPSTQQRPGSLLEASGFRLPSGR